jgi:DNA-binding transcriptional regulator YiaG
MKNQMKILEIINDCVSLYGSVTGLAEYLGLSRSTVSRWRSGKNSPSCDYLLMLQKIQEAAKGKR